MSLNNIQPLKAEKPQALSLNGDPRSNWKRFKLEFHTYLFSSGNDALPSNMKMKLFLEVVGDEGNAIYNDLELADEDKNNFSLVLTRLEEKIAPKRNIIYDRFIFHSRKQQQEERFDSFFEHLKQLAAKCKFIDIDGSLLDQVVFGINETAVQEQMFNTDDLNLKTAVEICQKAEARKDIEQIDSNVSSVTGVTQKCKDKKIIEVKLEREYSASEKECGRRNIPERLESAGGANASNEDVKNIEESVFEECYTPKNVEEVYIEIDQSSVLKLESADVENDSAPSEAISQTPVKCEANTASYISQRKGLQDIGQLSSGINLDLLQHICSIEPTCSSTDGPKQQGSTDTKLYSYWCEICSKTFTRKETLRHHLLTHTAEKPHRCECCGKCFSIKSNLNKHMALHKNQRHQCNLCNKSFTNKDFLQKHILSHNTMSEQLHRHHTSVDAELNLYRCDICATCLTTNGGLKQHMLTHTADRPHRCEDCGKCFSIKSNLNKHVLLHREQRQRCTFCSRTYTSKEYLKKHLLSHSGYKSDRPYQCEVCTKNFTRKVYLIKHIAAHNESPGQQDGSKATKETSQTSRGQLLIRPLKRPYRCRFCSVNFSCKTALKVHKSLHKGEKPHQCHICSKCFSLRSTLNVHLLTHTGEKCHQCHICSKSFSMRGTLSIHLLTHSGERPYRCDVCDKSFSVKEYLKRHTLVHTGEQPYSCKQCDKRFAGKSNLNKHMLTHTRERRHQCDICNKRYLRKEDLKKHLGVHDPPHRCEICSKNFSRKERLRKHMSIHTTK